MGSKALEVSWMGGIMRILVVCPPKNDMFRSLGKACYESFLSLGYEVDYAGEYKEGYDLALFVVFYHPWRIAKDSTIKVGYHLEQLPWGCDRKELKEWSRRFAGQRYLYDYIADHSINNIQWLQQHGCQNVFWCALGYHKAFEGIAQEEACPLVSFTGSHKERRRRKILRYISRGLNAHRIGINYSHAGFDKVCEAKIHLNIHNYEQGTFEAHRIIRLMCNKQFVLTEGISEHHPFQNGIHWAETDWHWMPDVILHYLNKDQERHKIVENCYNYIKQKYNFMDHLGRLIHEIEERHNG